MYKRDGEGVFDTDVYPFVSNGVLTLFDVGYGAWVSVLSACRKGVYHSLDVDITTAIAYPYAHNCTNSP